MSDVAMPDVVTPAGAPVRRVRVVIVDDAEDIRLLLRLSFRSDPRFEVVGEGVDGREAIELAVRERPDLMVLDRQMPVLGGVEALPEIRVASPRTAVVLYTAGADAGTYQAAVSAGAVQVVEKGATAHSVVDTLAGILVAHWASDDASVEVRVGPVASGAARLWVANTAAIIQALRRHPEVLTVPVPTEVLDLFARFLVTWGELAREQEVFTWVARTTPSEIQRLVDYWAAMDRLADEDLRRLGCQWSPPEALPFVHALTAAVIEALDAHSESRELARSLAVQWS
ncbi:MAG: hypothetical protein NVS3B12_16150 [Acidimicrobiales bacterium]